MGRMGCIVSHMQKKRLLGAHLVIEEDCWRSCPLSGGCCNPSEPLECTCGYDARVERIAHIIADCKAEVRERVAAYRDEWDILKRLDELDARCKCQCFGILGRISDWCRQQAKGA